MTTATGRDAEHEDKDGAPPGEPDTPRQAHDETAANVRRLREGDDIPQTDS